MRKCGCNGSQIHHDASHKTKVSGSMCASIRGARCGSSARRDLRGGRRATGVPTSIGRKSMNSRDQLLKSWERTTGFLRDARALISEAGEGICSDEIVEFQSCLDHNELECALTMLDENRGVSHEWH